MSKRTIIELTIFAAMTLASYGESLKKEADSILQTAIQSGTPEYTGYTERELIDQIIKAVDLDALPDEETRDETEFQEAVKEDESLADIKLTFSTTSIVDVVKNNSESTSKREAAYRLLSFFNSDRRKKILQSNIMNARHLIVLMYDEGVLNPHEVEKYRDLMFFESTPKETKDWIIHSESLEPIFLQRQVNGDVWFIAPELLSGTLIVAFRDYSVRSFPLEVFQDEFLDKINIKKQNKTDKATPKNPSD